MAATVVSVKYCKESIGTIISANLKIWDCMSQKFSVSVDTNKQK